MPCQGLACSTPRCKLSPSGLWSPTILTGHLSACAHVVRSSVFLFVGHPCYSCLAGQSSGNKTRGIPKRQAALAAIGQKLVKRGPDYVKQSLCSEGLDDLVPLLQASLTAGDASSRLVAFCRNHVRRSLARCSRDVIRVTLIEAPAFSGSALSRINALLGGASLRVVEPGPNSPQQLTPPTLVLGQVVEWPLDLSTSAGSGAFESYLSSVEPLHGTDLVHLHVSPPCTGTSIVNRNINKNKLSKATSDYHVLCRQMVGHAKRHMEAFRKGNRSFLRSKFRRSSSAEQPRNASLPGRRYSSRKTQFYRKPQMHCLVSGCICGAHGSDPRTPEQDLPVCKAWMFQTDHPVLAGCLSHLRCPKNHVSMKTFVEHRSQPFCRLSRTASYPDGLAWLFVGALSLPWVAGRTHVFPKRKRS